MDLPTEIEKITALDPSRTAPVLRKEPLAKNRAGRVLHARKVIAGEAGLQHAGAGVADDRQHCDCTAALPSSRCGKRRFTPFQKLICLERSVPFKGYKRPFCTSGDHCKFRTERGMWLRIL